MPLDHPGSNTADNDTAADWIRQIRRQSRLCDEANAVRRNLYKRAKSDGMDTKAITTAIRNTKLEPEEVEQNLAKTLHYMAIVHIPIRREAIFAWNDVVTSQTEHADEMYDAEDQGYRAGRHGAKVETAPFHPGTEAHVAWLAAWHKGQASIAQELGPDVKPADPSKARPERKRAAPTVSLFSDDKAAASSTPPAKKPRGGSRGYGAAQGRPRGRRKAANGGATTAAH